LDNKVFDIIDARCNHEENNNHCSLIIGKFSIDNICNLIFGLTLF